MMIRRQLLMSRARSLTGPFFHLWARKGGLVKGVGNFWGTREESEEGTEQLFQGSAPNSAMVSVSSDFGGGYEGSYAFDGLYTGADPDNRWISSDGVANEVNPDGRCWIQWDFGDGTPKKISQVRFGPRGPTGNVNNFPLDIRVLAGSDPTFAAFDVQNSIAGIVYVEGDWCAWAALTNKASARYLRIEIHDITDAGSLGGDYNIVAIQETEFYELV